LFVIYSKFKVKQENNVYSHRVKNKLFLVYRQFHYIPAEIHVLNNTKGINLENRADAVQICPVNLGSNGLGFM